MTELKIDSTMALEGSAEYMSALERSLLASAEAIQAFRRGAVAADEALRALKQSSEQCAAALARPSRRRLADAVRATAAALNDQMDASREQFLTLEAAHGRAVAAARAEGLEVLGIATIIESRPIGSLAAGLTLS